jgi:hypothetical protein
MKNAYPFLAMLVFLSLAFTSNAQTSTKPKLFNNFPEKIECNEADLAAIFSTNVGQNINVNFQSGLHFAGNVTSNLVRYSNLQSAVVKSPLFDNAVLSISKAINSDGSVEYTGRIINQNYFDGYQLAKTKTGTYVLTKIETDKILFTCQH